MSLPELVSLFSCDIEDDDDFYFRVAQNISLTDYNYLLEHLHEYNGSRLKGAVFGIGESPKKDEKQKSVLLSLLSHSEPLIIAEAIDSLRHSGYNELWARIEALLRHESPYVIGAALRYARFALPHDEAYAILTGFLSNPDRIVLHNAIDELDDLGDKRAASLIRPYCDDPDPSTRQAAMSAYENLAEIAEEL